MIANGTVPSGAVCRRYTSTWFFSTVIANNRIRHFEFLPQMVDCVLHGLVKLAFVVIHPRDGLSCSVMANVSSNSTASASRCPPSAQTNYHRKEAAQGLRNTPYSTSIMWELVQRVPLSTTMPAGPARASTPLAKIDHLSVQTWITELAPDDHRPPSPKRTGSPHRCCARRCETG